MTRHQPKITYIRLPLLPRLASVLFLGIGTLCQGQVADTNAQQSDRCRGPLGDLTEDCQAEGSASAILPKVTGMPAVPPSYVRSGGPSQQELPEKPVQLPPEPPGEFQRFTAGSVGKILPIFGASLFDKAPTTFAPNERAPVTDDYVVGPGDEVLLRVWGQVTINLELTVDRAGSIYIPQVGSVVVTGLRFQQLAGFLRTHLEQVFRNFDLTVNMGRLRSIQVFVAGQARRPGSYTVSSLSTLVNALFVSGGPSATGSMRRIQLKRGDLVIAEFDVYDLLLRGDKSKDMRLLPGDVIFVPPTGAQAAVAGSVGVQAIYELKTESSAGELVQMAGGPTPTADGRRATLERIGAGAVRQTFDVALDSSGLATPIHNGDVLQILTIPRRFAEAVTLRGNVAEPGRFPWRPGLRLSDIIPDKESLVTRSYWREHNQLGFIPPEAETVADTAAAAGPRAVPNTIDRDAPPINWSYAVVERRNPIDLSTQLLPFSPRKLVLDRDPEENRELKPGDVVTIFSQADIRVPQSQRTRLVRLEGEINSAGIYIVQAGETLAQVIDRAGGMTPEAYLYGAEFTRESIRQDQQARLDQVVDQMDREFRQQGVQQSGRFLGDADATRLRAEQENMGQLVARLRLVKASGRIVFGLEGDLADTQKLMGLPLEDGDVFMVPARPTTVNVLGAVFNQNAFLYGDNLRLEDYLRAAGGASRQGDKARMFIIRADGAVIPRRGSGGFHQSFESMRLHPGDTLVVPNSLPRSPFLGGLRDWTQVFSQLTLGAAAIGVLK